MTLNLVEFDNKSNPVTSMIAEKPDYIDKNHWEEWVNSGVDFTIISRNVESIHDSREVDKVLNRNSKSKWKHSEELVPCWQVSGIDPLTGEPTLLGVQVKPNNPVLNKEGKQQKYLGASDYETSPLFLNNGVEEYWNTVIKDKSIPVFFTEGAKKAGAGLTAGYATVSLPGVSTCRKKGRLHEWLKAFSGFGRTFYLSFDNDILHKKPVQDALLSMARELCATGSKVMVIELPPGDAKGMDDYIVSNGSDEFQKLVTNATTIEEWKQKIEELWAEQKLEGTEERKSRLINYLSIVEDGWGEILRLNQLKNCVELNGKTLDLNHARLRIALDFDMDVPLGDAQMIAELIAEKNAYSPVVEYLDDMAQRHQNVDISILDDLASRYFGSSEPMHNIYMRNTLVAAVARARQPGCRHDAATILVGAQGIYKSTFWQKLFGVDWFTDELGDANERDELMKLHRFWGLEWSEFETVYKRKDISSLKKFMATTVDAFRTPYSRAIREYPRRSILVGTTNEDEILADPTGSRRFWIIPVEQVIPIDLLEKERDLLWAAADALYKSGYQWFLTREERVKQEELNQDFQTDDPWTNAISSYIYGKTFTTIPDVLGFLEIESSRQDRGMSRRLSAIFRQLGWKRVRRRDGSGKPMWCWIPDVSRDLQLEEFAPSDPQVEELMDQPQTKMPPASQPPDPQVDPNDPQGKQTFKIENSSEKPDSEPELFVLGSEKERDKNVDLSSLIGKRVKVVTLDNALFDVLAIQSFCKKPLICQSVEKGFKALLGLEDLE